MGCKESKHKAVAQGNTIIAPSSGRKSTNRGQNVDSKNNVPSLQRSRSGRMQKQESSKKINVGESKVSKEYENLGDDNGPVNVNAVLEKESKRLKKLDDQIVKDNDNNNNFGGDGASIRKENPNKNVVPKVNLLSSSRNDGEGIEAIISDGISGTSAYYTPKTEVAGAMEINTKSDNSGEQKKESVEDIKDAKTAEEDGNENPTKDVDATAKNQARETEVNEKIKEAEAAVAALEDLVKEANEAEEILVTDVNATDATIQKPVNEAPGTEAEVTSANLEADRSEEIHESLQKPMEETDKSDQIQDNEAEASDETLQNADEASDKKIENLIKEAEEAADNGVKDIHEVIGKAKDVSVNEAATAEGNQKMVSDRAEEVSEKEAEVAFATPKDPVEENEVTDKAEAASISEESPAKESESETKVQSKDAAMTEEETKNYSTTDSHKKSKEDTTNN